MESGAAPHWRERERAIEQELLDETDDSSLDLNTVEGLQLKTDTVIGQSFDLPIEPSTGNSSRLKHRYRTVSGSRVFKEIFGEMGLGDDSRGQGSTSLESRRKKQKQEMLSDGPSESRLFFASDGLIRTDQRDQDKYERIKSLGRGGQGTAHLLKSRTTGALIVCKVIYKDEKHYQNYNIQLYLEYCDGGDLSALIRKFHRRYNEETREWDYYRVPESFIWHVFLQLAEALAYIHHGRDHRDPKTELPKENWLSVVHRDIKPHNVLLRRNATSHNPVHAATHDEPPYPNIILADFGMAISAREPGVEPTSSRHCGTERYQPPEKPHHSQKGNVYSLGAIICKLLTGDLAEENDLPTNINGCDDDDEGFEDWEAALMRLEADCAGAEFEEP
ncbi:MAG: hypothetical protein Q9194_007360 [Teloschistes cf. exilis]